MHHVATPTTIVATLTTILQYPVQTHNFEQYPRAGRFLVEVHAHPKSNPKGCVSILGIHITRHPRQHTTPRHSTVVLGGALSAVTSRRVQTSNTSHVQLSYELNTRELDPKQANHARKVNHCKNVTSKCRNISGPHVSHQYATSREEEPSTHQVGGYQSKRCKGIDDFLAS